jgi:hypothetical protein
MSIDGYIAGPQGELDWLVRDWGEDLMRCVRALVLDDQRLRNEICWYVFDC